METLSGLTSPEAEQERSHSPKGGESLTPIRMRTKDDQRAFGVTEGNNKNPAALIMLRMEPDYQGSGDQRPASNPANWRSCWKAEPNGERER